MVVLTLEAMKVKADCFGQSRFAGFKEWHIFASTEKEYNKQNFAIDIINIRFAPSSISNSREFKFSASRLLKIIGWQQFCSSYTLAIIATQLNGDEYFDLGHIRTPVRISTLLYIRTRARFSFRYQNWANSHGHHAIQSQVSARSGKMQRSPKQSRSAVKCLRAAIKSR